MDWLSALIERFITAPSDLRLAQKHLAAIPAGGDAAGRALIEACRLLGEASEDSAGLIDALDAVENPAALDLFGLAVVHSFAAVRAPYPARPDAQAARARLVARAQVAVEAAGDAFGFEAHGWLSRLTGAAAVQISRIAATRAPLVRVETGMSLPAQLLAYDLYGDPARDAELVARAKSATPMLMPVSFEALAP